MGCGCSKPMPGALKLATNASKAAGRVVVGMVRGKVIVPDGVFKYRMDKCKSCEACVPHPKGYHRCAKCGCWLDGVYFSKAKLATESCPLGQWEDK